MKTEISVLIATRNRCKQFAVCIDSVIKSLFRNFEIIIVDQSDDDDTKTYVSSLRSPKIKYFKLSSKGKSMSLNYGIRKAVGSLIVFTDDDCIVDCKWLQNIHQKFNKYPDIHGLFGCTYPHLPGKHLRQVCAATYVPVKFILHKIDDISDISREMIPGIGLGNNMCIKKKIFSKIGYFKEWLGPGAIGQNGEESEYIFRMLANKLVLATDPEIVVFHNRWINGREARILESQYTHGFVSFASYYLLQKDFSKQAELLITSRLKERLVPAFKSWRRSFRSIYHESSLLLSELISVVGGCIVGLYMYIIRR